MSFCNEVKSELALVKGHRCCQRAEAMGLALAVKPSGDRLVFRTTLAEVSHLSSLLLDKHMGCVGKTHISASGQWYSTYYAMPTVMAQPRISADKLQNGCCTSSFVRGVFLSCGHMNDPQKGYRLDFLLPDEASGAAFCDILREQGFLPRRSLRKDGSVCVYFLDSTSIEDLLTFMGATASTLTLMEVKVEKNYANALNRRGNFDTANYVKTFAKAEQQTASIHTLQQAGEWEALPEDTKEIGRLRLENSDASLNELAKLSHTSRSHVDRKLKAIMALANEVEKRR